MSEPTWRGLKCTTCKTSSPSLVVVRWRFDKDGTFHILVVCRICFQKAMITHTFEEQQADSREDYLLWLTDQQDPMSVDMLIWENELLEGDDDAES